MNWTQYFKVRRTKYKYTNKIVTMTTIEKLKKLRDENPALAEAIETKFPEIIDATPFITSNVLFMKRNNDNSIYQLILSNNEFRVKNLKYNKYWGSTVKPTNIHECKSANDYYLTKNDFKQLLKDSYVKIDSILIINSKHLSNLYISLTS